MRLSAPKKGVFWIGLILIIVGLLSSLFVVPYVSAYNNWVSFAGGALLTLGCLLKGF